MSAILLPCFLLLSFLAYQLHRWYRKGFVEGFSRKSVFITGTDSGFGRQLALELDQMGLTVFAGCFCEESLQKLRSEASGRMRVCRVDVTSRESIIQAKDFVQQSLGPGQGLWALVNNAGIGRSALFEFSSMKDYRDVLDVNFFGAVETTEIFLPLIKRTRGRIVNVVSIMGRCSLAAGPYSASKFAMESYSDGLRRTLRHFGIKVSIMEPGFFRTNITDPNIWGKDLIRQWNNLTPEMKEEYGEKFVQEVKFALEEFGRMPPISNFNTIAMVTEGITHAICAKRPKDRYVIGLDGHLMYRPLSLLPDWALDFMIHVKSRHVYSTMAIKNKHKTAK